MKKRMKLIIGLGLIVLLGVVTYWYYPKSPSAFLSDKELALEINNTQSNMKVKQIQDKVAVDDKHFFVPFITTNGDYGTSYWEWQRTKWKVLNIDNTGEPMIWKINKNDPSTYRLVWNLHKDDKVDHMKFYLNRERSFQVSNGIEYYYPKVQMEKKITITAASYGSQKLPNEWISVVDSFVKIESSVKQSLFDDFDLDRHLYFAWMPYDKTGKEAIIEHSVNGYSFTVDDIELDFVRWMNNHDLESQ
ncbi:hypothetical protein ACFQ4X_03760 [Fictibacillus halophilus]|uniref:hypothetical protein n=1 Tax=Fictibacillus halophilus TaxID=1610490 RepID=UPI0036446032